MPLGSDFSVVLTLHVHVERPYDPSGVYLLLETNVPFREHLVSTSGIKAIPTNEQ